MKRIIISLVLMTSIFTIACDVATEKVPVSVLLPAGYSSVHIAVFEGTPSEETIIAQGSYMSQNVTLEVPVGENRYFLTLAENSAGVAALGSIDGPVVIRSDRKSSLSIKLKEFAVSNGNWFGFGYTFATNVMTWKNFGATSYELGDIGAAGAGGQIPIYYVGPNNYFQFPGYTQTEFGVRCHFSYFNDLSTEWTYQYMP